VEQINQQKPEWLRAAFELDIASAPAQHTFDAIYCLDVFEHIEPERENQVLDNLKGSLSDEGVAIIGIPSLESQTYASEYSKLGHVNCQSGSDFKALLEQHFKHVFLFSMNDEVVHTGFYPMAHYLLALCVK
jgi:2-polyprenyl-3-methyl-5-hydroxy-6-metoxy-1,4-benzoquinol methylase